MEVRNWKRMANVRIQWKHIVEEGKIDHHANRRKKERSRNVEY